MAKNHMTLRDENGVMKAKFTLEHGMHIVKNLQCRNATNAAKKLMFVCEQDLVVGNDDTRMFIWKGDCLIIEDGEMA